MSALQPGIGEWYSLDGGDSFEIVAVDEDDRTVEVQHFDGTVEEFDLDDWQTQHANGTIVEVEAPEDWSGSVDAEDADEEEFSAGGDRDLGLDQSMSAARLDGLDLFE